MSRLNSLCRITFAVIALASCVTLTVAPARADAVTPGLTFTVAQLLFFDDGSLVFRSNSTTNPPNKAEVGRFVMNPGPASTTITSRGLSEFNLAGLTPGSATLTFDVFRAGGLTGEPPAAFDVSVLAYQGNNAENLLDYGAGGNFGTVGSFNTAGLAAGQSLSFDVTLLYNMALTNRFSALGIRLQLPSPTSGVNGMYTFDNFRLTTPASAIPEPATLLLLGTGLVGGIAVKVRKRRKERSSKDV